METKRQARERQTFNFIGGKPTNGYITTKDLISLEKLKLEIFPDYDELEGSLKHMKAVRNGWKARLSSNC